VDEVARIIGGQQRSVYYWAHRYLDHHRVADLYDASRAGRPRTAAQITKAHILRELARDPLKLGYNTNIYMFSLFQIVDKTGLRPAHGFACSS
jgi:hypothetical protein